MIYKIVLFGPECTGKTTLAQQLAAYYHTTWVPEYSRSFQLQKGSPIALEDVVSIAQGQLQAEQEAVRQANRILICDTDILETKVYSEAYFGECPQWLLDQLWKYPGDLYLLTNIDLPWEPDEVRDRPDQRESMYQLFKRELDERNLPYIPIAGTAGQRLNQAQLAINHFLFRGPYPSG